MVEPAYIALDGKSGGEFAFCCVTGNLHCRPSRHLRRPRVRLQASTDTYARAGLEG
jgi:hypothetical protein